ncbi:MAG: HAD family phosphatase [Ruminococcus sp.]|nr:HAD family phosphatase [Ruminococcus sp.]
MNKKILFACDLDNTLLHSHRRKAEGAICAEVLDGKEQSFFTPLAYKLIGELTAREDVIFLPVTTRSKEQYKRIKFPEGCTPKLALVCNGAVLLEEDEPEKLWYEESEKLTAPYRDELNSLCEKYSEYECYKTVRIVDDMFLFVYCYNKDEIESIAAECMKDTFLTVEYSGSKMYFFPPVSNKGYGVKRFAERYGCERIISAGDSMIDCSMLEIADTALVPDEKMRSLLKNENTLVCNEEHFSEFILKYVLNNNLLTD